MNYSELSLEAMMALQIGNQINSGYRSEELNITGNCKNKLYIFKDEFSNIHLAIELTSKKDTSSVIEPNINGLKISTDEFILKANGKKNWYLNLSCTDQRMVSIFCALVKDLCHELEISNFELSVTINNVIRTWKSFWSADRLSAMSDQAVVGLFAELIVFRDLASRNSLIALDSWRGPMKERHDFILNDLSIEIKGTTSNKKTYSIHGLDQLTPFPNRRLYLITFDLKIITSSKAISLVDLIAEILIYFNGDQEMEDKFRSLLSSSGYSPLFNDSLQERKIEVLSSAIYEVDNKFPALTSNSIDKNILPIITNVQYDLTLSGINGNIYNSADIVEMI